MPRPLRPTPGGLAYHVMNRRVAGLPLFDGPGDYQAFLQVLIQARDRFHMRICAFVFMPNHWHLVPWPRRDGELSEFMRWLSMTHTQRWHAHRHSAGSGHLYQSRFKSFPIQQDGHFLAVCRYVERNPLRAGLVTRAEAWPWSSLAIRSAGKRVEELLDPWPVGGGRMPRNWSERVNAPESAAELAALRRCAARGQPFGQEAWVKRMAASLGLESLLHPRGRPRKEGATA